MEHIREGVDTSAAEAAVDYRHGRHSLFPRVVMLKCRRPSSTVGLVVVSAFQGV